jgi:hypothetical protein
MNFRPFSLVHLGTLQGSERTDLNATDADDSRPMITGR